jgi:phosphatidylglycerol:prolipoprotein diacylglycerol transferase
MLPILFQSHDLVIYSYPLLMGIGWGVGYQSFLSRSVLPYKYTLITFWGIFVSAWLGAKGLFLVTIPERASQELLISFNFWTGGGFVFYGGLLGAAGFLLLYRILKFPWSSKSLWSLIPALTMGHAIGRLGCFLAGCCYGKETDWWWGVHLHGADRHPTQLLESLGLFLLSWIMLKRPSSRQNLRLYLVTYGGLRFVLEFLRGDIIRGSWSFLTPSQWISLGLLLVGLIFWNKLRNSAT